MGLGSGAYGTVWLEHLVLLQNLMYTLNSIFFVVGSATFSVAVYIRFDDDMNDYVDAADLSYYWTGTNVIMAGAIIVMINSFLACCSIYLRSLLLLISYMVLTVVSFGMLLGGGTWVLLNGMEDTKIFPVIQERMRERIYLYQWDVNARRSVDIIQEYVGCCGGYSSSDFSDIHVPIPDTCRDQVTGNQYGDSCGEILSQFMEQRTAWVSALALSICFFQIFGLMYAVCLFKAHRELSSDRK